MFPGISRPGRELGEGRYIRNTSCLGGLVTDDQAADHVDDREGRSGALNLPNESHG